MTIPPFGDVSANGSRQRECPHFVHAASTQQTSAGLKLCPRGCDIVDQHDTGALNPPDVRWWRLNIVRYPSLRDFMEIELTPEFRSIYRHKVAALSPICSPATVPTLPESSVGR